MKYINLFICPVCGGNTDTFRHPFAKVWCPNCGHVLREEGDRSIQHSGLSKIEPLSMVYTGHTENGISYCTGSRPADNRELMNKLNEVIERQNRIIDYLNEMVKK